MENKELETQDTVMTPDVYRKTFSAGNTVEQGLYRLQTGKLFSRTYKNQEVPNSQMIK